MFVKHPPCWIFNFQKIGISFQHFLKGILEKLVCVAKSDFFFSMTSFSFPYFSPVTFPTNKIEKDCGTVATGWLNEQRRHFGKLPVASVTFRINQLHFFLIGALISSSVFRLDEFDDACSNSPVHVQT